MLYHIFSYKIQFSTLKFTFLNTFKFGKTKDSSIHKNAVGLTNLYFWSFIILAINLTKFKQFKLSRRFGAHQLKILMKHYDLLKNMNFGASIAFCTCSVFYQI